MPHLLPVRRGLLATCYVRTDADARALIEEAYADSPVVRVLPEGMEPEIGRVQGTDAAEIGVFADHSTGMTIVICADRQPRQGRRRAGGAEREPRARARARRPGCGWGASLVLSVHSPRKGFVASGVAAGIRRRDRRDLAIVRSVPHATGRAMFTRNRVQAACLTVNREHLALADPQAVVINSGVANAATGERGKLDALATAAEAARLLDLTSEEVLVLSTGVIGARLPLHKLLPALEPAVAGLAERRRPGRRRGDHDHRHRVQGGRRSREAASRSAGWPRARG